MKKIAPFGIIALVAVMVTSYGCKKENTDPNGNAGSSSSTTGTLYYKNTQVDPYTIYLDGASQGVLASGNTSTGFTVTTGVSHTLKAVQYSGYVLYATVIDGTATLNPGGSVTWNF